MAGVALLHRVAVQRLAIARVGLLRRSSSLAPLGGPRHFASKVVEALQGEIKHEEGNYEPSKEIKAFLKDSPFKLVDADGDVNMTLERELGDKTVKIEWQLTSPFDPDMGGEQGDDGEPEREATELAVTVEKKDGSGVMFYCSTQTGEDHRYVIGNVRTFNSAEEKDGMSSYNGPEFEDLDDKLQEAFDEYLADVGMSSEVCDFIDAMAVDKEQREYLRWLKNAAKCLE
jgi:complement component 1 Q subcomponent-binding protein